MFRSTGKQQRLSTCFSDRSKQSLGAFSSKSWKAVQGLSSDELWRGRGNMKKQTPRDHSWTANWQSFSEFAFGLTILALWNRSQLDTLHRLNAVSPDWRGPSTSDSLPVSQNLHVFSALVIAWRGQNLHLGKKCSVKNLICWILTDGGILDSRYLAPSLLRHVGQFL